MARISGRKGSVYVDLAGGGSASPVANLNQWNLNGASEQLDATSFGDTTKTYVLGLPDAQGTIAGWFDTLTPQTYTASQDGLSRKTYLYPDVSVGTYWFGTAFWDFSVDTAVGGVVSISANWVAATPFYKVQA